MEREEPDGADREWRACSRVDRGLRGGWLVDGPSWDDVEWSEAGGANAAEWTLPKERRGERSRRNQARVKRSRRPPPPPALSNFRLPPPALPPPTTAAAQHSPWTLLGDRADGGRPGELWAGSPGPGPGPGGGPLYVSMASLCRKASSLRRLANQL